MEMPARQPGASIWEASENRAEAKAVCRTLGNEGFDRREIAKARREAATRRMVKCGGPILAVHDTTGVNCNARLKVEGIGYISGKTLGVDVHSRLAAASNGLVLGVLYQSGYNRSEPQDETASHESEKVRPLEEKESFRRLEALERSAADIPKGVKMTTVCGREGDMAD
jgi:hypothetical protein